MIFPYSNLQKAIGKVLVKEGFLEEVKIDEISGKKVLTVVIKYRKRKPVFTDVSLVSKPSLRVYIRNKNMGRENRNGTISIVSTNKGIITAGEAHKENIGGELLFRIW